MGRAPKIPGWAQDGPESPKIFGKTGGFLARPGTTRPMPKWPKMFLAVLFLPLCWGAVAALIKVLQATGHAESFWLALLGGMACWWAIFLLLPKPMWVYVFGHELTHALWTWLFGGRVRKFKVTSKG